MCDVVLDILLMDGDGGAAEIEAMPLVRTLLVVVNRGRNIVQSCMTLQDGDVIGLLGRARTHSKIKRPVKT